MSSKFQDRVYDCIRFWFPRNQILVNYRPEWLKGCEIDIFLPELNFGIEVNGWQHYIFTPAFHKNMAEFQTQQNNDKWKLSECKNRKISIIIVRELHNPKDVIKNMQFDIENIINKILPSLGGRERGRLLMQLNNSDIAARAAARKLLHEQTKIQKQNKQHKTKKYRKNKNKLNRLLQLQKQEKRLLNRLNQNRFLQQQLINAGYELNLPSHAEKRVSEVKTPPRAQIAPEIEMIKAGL
ncbi:MAG: hypothetical protein AABY22_32895 [Nanoarchaeota archaeon]